MKKAKLHRRSSTLLVMGIALSLFSHGHAEVIWSKSFDDYETGKISRDQAMEIFESYWASGPDEGRVEISEQKAVEGNRKSLKVHYPKGEAASSKSGFTIDCNIGVEADSLWLTYYVYFPDNFDWRDGGKLPGLKGSAGWRQGTYEWTGRLMWRQNGLAQWYMRGTNQRQINWIDPVTKDSTKFIKGQWNKIELFYKINPVPGNMGGSELRAYLNGELAKGSQTVQMFQDQGEKGVKINTLFLCTFFGGGSKQEHFPVKDEYAFFDNFTVSTSRLNKAPPAEPPVVAVTAPDNNSSFALGETITINADAHSTDGSISWVDFRVNDTFYFRDSTPPYSTTFTPNNVGSYILQARAFNNSGDSTLSSSITVVVAEPKAPFAGEPVALPGKLWAAEYDKGGQGISYHDTAPLNRGVERGVNFRTDEAVDINNHPDSGYVIGWIAQGEWVEYTVEVTGAAEYELEFYISSLNGGGSIGIDVGGETLLSGITVPRTGDWDSYEKFTKKVTLDAGEQVWRVNMENGGFNFYKIVVKLTDPTALGLQTVPLLKTKPQLLPNSVACRIFYLSTQAPWEIYSLQGARLKSGNGKVIDMSSFTRGAYLIHFSGITERLMLR